MIRAPTSGIRALGNDEDVAEARVEALGDVAHQLDVLALVVADRDLVGSVGEHVGRLEDGIEEKARGDELPLLLRLLLELVHAVEVAIGGDRRQQPAELGVLVTSDWRKRMQRSGSSPAAIRIAAVSWSRSRSSAGSCGTVIACRSTMQ